MVVRLSRIRLKKAVRKGTDVQRRAIGAGIAAVLTVVLCACARPGETSPTSVPIPRPASSSTPLDIGQFTPAPSGAIDEDTGETITPAPVAVWDEASRAGAVAAAKHAMSAFARPGLAYETWWAELAPLLTQQAQQDYAYVDPAAVPATAVTGAATLVDETSAYVARVQVPTDAGAYTLVLTRADGAAPWLVSRFTPPEAGS
ncbi:hypothetical protein AB6N23_01805 [Cellulomonas sp. 179-A 9B4 NHS]|uniref:hypothetical protein n=1 Tax=Cellulomonas sp. 179-A 9B4 NHS TaxID=3142379 RepID=UPI00399FA26C